MKGDEVVEVGEKGANLTLFRRGRIAEIHFGDVLIVDVYYRLPLSLLGELVVRRAARYLYGQEGRINCRRRRDYVEISTQQYS